MTTIQSFFQTRNVIFRGAIRERKREVMVGPLEWPTETLPQVKKRSNTQGELCEDMGSDLVKIVRLFPTLYCNFILGVKGRTLFGRFTTGILST